MNHFGVMEEERLVKRKQRARRDGNVRQLAEISKEIGDIYFETGRLQDALLEYNEQMQACEVLNDKLNCAIAHRMIGEVHASLGHYEEALMHQTLHLEGAKEVSNMLEQQRALATIGRTHFCLGESLTEDTSERQEAFASAKKAYYKSLKLCNQLENTDISPVEMTEMKARLLLNLGLLFQEQNESQQAIELIEKAGELCKKYKLENDLHRTQLALGSLYERRNQFGLALKHVEMAIEVGDSSMKAVGQLTKAELLLRLGQWHDARQILVRLYLSKGLPQTTSQQIERLLRIVVTICRAEDSLDVETDTKTRQKLYEKLGDAAAAVRCYQKAVECYREMLTCAEEEDCDDQISAALVSLSQTLRDAGQYAEAVPFARRELQLCTEPREICRSALNLADLLDRTQSEKSNVMEIYNLALSTARSYDNRSLEATVLQDIVVYLESVNELDKVKEFKEQLDLVRNALTDSASEAESESTNIGADICLEDLSDVEAEIRKKGETSTRSSRRSKRGLVVRKNEKGETKLHVACINGNIEEVEKLLKAGHPTDVEDYCGWSPLHEAANHGFVEITELLIKAGADINCSGGSGCGGVTPLHDAASCGHFSTMWLLIKHGVNLMVRTKEGDTVLDYLEDWRNREENLSPIDQAEYDNIHRMLSTVLPKSTKLKNKSMTEQSRSKRSGSLGSSESESEDCCSGVERISAGEDYRRTIASLKNRNKPVAISRKRYSSPKKIITPLINSEEMLIDDWLEDDLNSTVKERTLIEDGSGLTIKRKSSNSTPEGYTTKKQKMSSNESSDKAPHPDISETSCDSNTSEISEIFHRRSAPKAVKKRQLSLLKSGFTRDTISRTPSPIYPHPSESFSNFKRNVEATNELVKLKIRVGEKDISLKLRFPEQRDTIVAGLMNEIVEIYECETGCKVQITLMTMSGEVLRQENTLKSVKPTDGVINLMGEIVDIQIPPITDRYKKIVRSSKIESRETILKCLKVCENTSTFRFKTGEALDEEIVPLLRSLEYQQNLQVLYMSSASLYDLGITMNSTLSRLETLQELHLQGCDIDHKCLLKIERLPLQLRVLDLSYNPLGPRCEEKLYKLISHHRLLQTLNLRFCKLERFKSSDSWGSLVNLDLSWNSIGGEGVSSFLQRQMLNLNLSNTTHPLRSPVIKEIINGSKLSLTTLENLELACCDVTDADVINILVKSPNLCRFVLNSNTEITKIAVEALLNYKPTLSYIDVAGCEKIIESPDPDTHIENPRICTVTVSMSMDIKQSWLRLWRGAANAYILPHDIIKFKPLEY